MEEGVGIVNPKILRIMIVMMISDAPAAERKVILSNARNQAALLTDDLWEWIECGSLEELRQVAAENRRIDVFCIDLTIEGSLDVVRTLRCENPESYIILIADCGISPVVYMRPQIRAESLMLKPLTVSQISNTLHEAIFTYLGRSGSDERKSFLVECRGEKSIIEYGRINFFESREKRIFLCTDSEEFGFYDTIDQLEEKLSGDFLRVHRSFLINKKKIAKVSLSKNRVYLMNGEEIPMSRSYKSSVKLFFDGCDRGGKNRESDIIV